MRFDLLILGSNSALPAHGRHPSAQVLKMENELFLIDCGEGTQVRLSELHVKRGRINQIFISHLHGDHYFGLIGLLTSYALLGRSSALHLYAPAGLQEIINVQLKHSNTELPYPLLFHVCQDRKKELIYESEHVEVYSIPLSHRIPTTGFLFQEKQRAPKMRKEKIVELSLDVEEIKSIKRGNDLVRPELQVPLSELVYDSPLGRSFAYCSDTEYLPSLIPHIQGVDLLYHEATFDKSLQERAQQTAHSTTHDAAKIAKAAEVGQLLIGHFSTKYSDLNFLLEEAREIFPDTELAIEGQTICVPFSTSVS